MSAIRAGRSRSGPQTSEQTRARYPDEEGYIERDGVRVFYEVYGDGEPTILFLPDLDAGPLADLEDADPLPRPPLTASSSSTRAETARATGRRDAEAYAESEFAQDASTSWTRPGPSARSSSALSRGAQRALLLAAEHPERVHRRSSSSGPWFPASRSLGGLRWRLMSHPRLRPLLMRKPLTTRSWAKFNAHYIRGDYRDFVEWFIGMAPTNRIRRRASTTASSAGSRPIPRR